MTTKGTGLSKKDRAETEERSDRAVFAILGRPSVALATVAITSARESRDPALPHVPRDRR